MPAGVVGGVQWWLLHCCCQQANWTTLPRLQMKRSTVVGVDGKSVLDDYRTSYGTFVM
jgi:hypothetical protein